jgi:hypothetical protein
MTALRVVSLACLAAGLSLACDNAGESFSHGVGAVNVINAGAFFDRDGSGTFNAPDTLFAGVKVNLVSPGGTIPVASGVTDAGGLVDFTGVSVGRYTVVVDTTGLGGDSLVATGAIPSEVTITATGTAQSIAASFGFAISSISSVRGLPGGTRVLVKAGVLAGRTTFSDTTANVSDNSGAIRLTNASGAVSAPGDSVRIVGTVGNRKGQPVINNAQIFSYFLINPGDPPPQPVSASTHIAATADGGLLDAALVAVTGATIADTSTVGNDFVIGVDDGSGRLEVVFDSNLGPPAPPAPIGGTFSGNGVLVPVTGSIWQLRVRADTDVTIN